MGTVSPCHLTNMAHLLLFLGLLPGIFAQDTHYCPDGWSVSEIDGEIECILLSGLQERVTKADAEAICASHDGWLVDMDEGTGPQKNNFLKQLVSQADGRGQPGRPGMQWDSQWDHSGADIAWYDWMRNEPNDFRTQNCLTFLKDQDIFGYGVYHWNDWDCAATARFICERAPISPM